ncbi:MAG: glycosyltransferase [Bacteroidetes bacterium]|nr:glycosyltransferase [Bacteroidota bacterium]
MPERLKILHVVSWFPSEVHQSLGNFIERHIEAVATMHDCEVWAPIAITGSRSTLAKLREKHGQEVREVAGRTWSVKRLYHEATRPQLLGVARAVAGEAITLNWTPDVVHLHVAYPAGSAAVAWAKRWGVPVILTEHWTAYHDIKALPWWRRKAIKDVVRAANFVCPVTANLGEAIRKWVPTVHIRVVPNVVDVQLFQPAKPEMLAGVIVGASRRKLEGAGATHFLHVSSMDDNHKNITGLILGMARAMKEVDSFRLTLVGGEHVDAAPYHKLVQELGMSNKISFTGPLPLTKVAQCMQSHDALVLNSRVENFPCVIAEAWASGLPVISTDVGGIGEHLPQGRSDRGVLLPKVADAEVWAEALQSVHQTSWDSANIRAYASAHFSNESVAETYTQVYHEAMEKKRGPSSHGGMEPTNTSKA